MIMRENFFLKNFRATFGKAVNDYSMLENHDRILVAFSGGKDSIALYDLLNSRKQRVPISYEIIPVFVYNGDYEETIREVEEFFKKKYSVNVIVKTVDIKSFVSGNSAKENPCFVCSKIRRKILFDLAYELKCNKLALGHNMDDTIETLMLNIFYSGNISTMMPKQKLFNGQLTIIRPLVYLSEAQILKYIKMNKFDIIEKKCSYKGKSKQREKVKEIIEMLSKENKKVRKNIANSIRNVNLDYLPIKKAAVQQSDN